MSDAALRQVATQADLPPEALQQALEWLVTVWSSETSLQELQALAQWREAHPDHERAWQRVQHISDKLGAVASPAAGRSLRESQRAVSRRKVLVSLGLLILGGTGALHTWRHPHLLQARLADLRTATGEIRTLRLADGSRLTVNTASALNIHFSADERRLQLIEGEILIATAPDPAARPFIVETDDGSVRPIGTRFIVRRTDGHTGAAVLEGAVRLQPAAGKPIELTAGRQARFTADAAGAVHPADAAAAAWTEGLLVAEQMRLADFLAELDRYRPGIIRCHPEVAGLRVSGTFPVGDTDRILAALADALPIHIHTRTRTRYWVVIEPAG